MIWFRQKPDGLEIQKLKPRKTTMVNVFNNYFGGGMGSLVFQTIRESKVWLTVLTDIMQPQKKTKITIY